MLHKYFICHGLYFSHCDPTLRYAVCHSSSLVCRLILFIPDTLSQQPQPFSVSASHFAASIGKLCDFSFIPCILMLLALFLAISMSYTTLCPSVGPFYVSVWPLRHSVSSICLSVNR